MIGQKPFIPTEWDWFKLQLRLHAIESSAKLFVTRYGFPEPKDRISQARFSEAYVHCLFWCKTTEDLLKKRASRATHLGFYESWVQVEIGKLNEILRGLPELSKELDLRKNVLFTVLHNYGMGSIAVCNFFDEKVHWEMSVEQVPE
jgi:hypothetical protein